jgi:hypothetical protein
LADGPTIAAFLGGLGAGSVITAFLQHLLSRHAQRADNLRKDRSEVYAGLLQALQALEVTDSVANAKLFGMWAARAEIVASSAVVEAITTMRATSPNSPERGAALAHLLRCMRSDLHPS